MTFYSRVAFGSNPHTGVNPNSDNGWGGYQWPGGVPSRLLSTLKFKGKLGTTVMVGRRELMPLVAVLMQITEQMGYYFHPGWCWSYANRAVTGGTHPSNHSRARAFDFNAPKNPFSWAWQCDIPPAVVALWESHGFYWGGRYQGQPTDAMHFEFYRTIASIKSLLTAARKHLGKGNDMTTLDNEKSAVDYRGRFTDGKSATVKERLWWYITDGWQFIKFTAGMLGEVQDEIRSLDKKVDKLTALVKKMQTGDATGTYKGTLTVKK